jgi:hypothetical protein
MKATTKTKTSEPFDWEEHIFQIMQPKSKTEYRPDLAEKWDTSPAGQLPPSIPRRVDGQPVDDQIGRLDVQFYCNYCAKEWDMCLKNLRDLKSYVTETYGISYTSAVSANVVHRRCIPSSCLLPAFSTSSMGVGEMAAATA